MKKEKTLVMRLRIPETLFNKVAKKATEECTSMASVIRKAIKKSLK